MKYTQQNLLRLGKRYQNQKRSYLLINPLQAKHLAVAPSKALEMMQTLGQHLYEQYADTKCIIGFAETATAIAGAAAFAFPPDILYIQTTRELLPETHTVLTFSEEHSHAVKQQLDMTRIQLPESAPMLLIDDEISTGKTVANMVSVMRREIPSLKESRFAVGSVLNRMLAERKMALASENLEFSALLMMEQTNFESAVKEWTVSAPAQCEQKATDYTELSALVTLKNTRWGVSVGEMRTNLETFSEAYSELLADIQGKILVLGTEECMLPALFLGEKIEQRTDADVFCHATTRSPIGISTAENYPIQNGFRIRSFYEEYRTTYLYNIDRYDVVVVVTDSQNNTQIQAAMQDIGSLFPHSRLYLIRG